MRSFSAFQSSRTAPKRKSANSSVAIPASCASAGVGYWQPTHGTSWLIMRFIAGR